jgi:hypothetical protein
MVKRVLKGESGSDDEEAEDEEESEPEDDYTRKERTY